jgi:hypothetical protein
MAENYVLLETIELSQVAASVTFDNLPSTGYSDLKIVISGRELTGTSLLFTMQINGVGTNQTTRELRANGTAASSGTNTIGTIDQSGSGTTASTFGSAEVYIPNYTSSNTKSFSIHSVGENNAGTAYQRFSSGLWSQTSPITSLSFFPSSGNIAQYSTFSLYGLAAYQTTPVTAPFATGGNIVANDGTYWYHAFLNSGTFTPLKDLSCNYLVVAGGGGGGWAHAAGGGAGGLRSATGQSLTSATAYPVVIGAGGVTGTGYGATSKGTNGVDSTFNSMTSTGGGAGGGSANGAWGSGNSGGSGGGGSYTVASQGLIGAGNTPSTSPSQGNNGGTGSTAPASGGGGGGAAATGTSGAPGAGGIGSLAFSDWGVATTTGHLVSTTRYFAGGGGGGVENATGAAGGWGGGGAGVGSTGATGGAGIVNTGGGGGGGGYSTHPGGPGGSGGSGIVIIRYPMV